MIKIEIKIKTCLDFSWLREIQKFVLISSHPRGLGQLLPISLINNSTQRHGDAETLRKTGFNFEFSLGVSASLRLSIDVALQTDILRLMGKSMG